MLQGKEESGPRNKPNTTYSKLHTLYLSLYTFVRISPDYVPKIGFLATGCVHFLFYYILVKEL